ncbi:hypothetical protein JCM12298_16590 [Desulfothermus naphthae]
MGKKRRHYTPEEKVMILKKNLLENVPVLDVCDEYNIHPTLFYRWQKEFFEKGSMVFEKEEKGHISRLEKKIAALEDKLSQKNEVLAELMEEYVSLKKFWGEFKGYVGGTRY